MNRILLKKLAITDGASASKSVEFVNTVTVVHGHSNTGKTFIRDLIDYILGSGDPLRSIKEASQYVYGCLEIEVNEKAFTIIRNLRGGEILFADKKFDEIDFANIDKLNFEKLITKHLGNGNSISEKFLHLSGMSKVKILSDSNFTEGSVKEMSLRNLVKLILINEQQIISDSPPILSAAEVTEQTRLKTIFTYLMTGIDYSKAILKTPTNEVKEARVVGRRETLQGLLKEMKQDRNVGSVKSLTKKLEDLNNQFDQLQEQIGDLRGGLEDKEQIRTHYISSRRELNEKYMFLNDQIKRFEVLHQSYLSDQERLDGVIDAAHTLDKMGDVKCPVCGSDPTHQSKHITVDTKSLIEACSAEMAKVSLLAEDLEETIAHNKKEVAHVRAQLDDSNSQLSKIETEQGILEKLLSSTKLKELEDLIKARQEVKSDLSYLGSLQAIKEKFSVMVKVDEDENDSTAQVSHMTVMPGSAALDVLSNEIKSLLVDWRLIRMDDNVFIDEQGELTVAGKKRRDCGKGVRAMYHTAFSLALLNVCMDKGLPHPGFVVIDSPLTSHKGEDVLDSDGEVSDENRRAFYESLARAKWQTIIIDNYGPPKSSSLHSYYFDKGHGFA
ncbi:MAG: hypothetical protein DI585_01420 [Pseudomonas fluorescens]|nr:MAG: hypothetical protein DI585_01420 [Pseudomonas fluorescens]